MKYLSTRFEDYIIECKKKNMHKELEQVTESFKKNYKDQCNLIYYGSSGVGKYTQALNFIKEFSPSNLRFERKLNFTYNKRQYKFKVSDVHFEIDMQLLGCNAKVLFNEIYYHILDILSTRAENGGIILCKNFNFIHPELLEIFYSYMESLQHKHLNVLFILLTEHVSFIPNNILDKCLIIPVKKCAKSNYIRFHSSQAIKKFDSISNIKNIQSNITNIDNINKSLSLKIVDDIINYKNIDFMILREKLYNIFTYNLDLYECIYIIVNTLIEKNYIIKKKTEHLFIKMHKFLKLYNNNYRPIYHLESFVCYLCIIIHGL
tara:strand:- start:2591 stop:3547 length:957 start_codon:yes stop_codon:yes gene_type:complete